MVCGNSDNEMKATERIDCQYVRSVGTVANSAGSNVTWRLAIRDRYGIEHWKSSTPP